MTIRDQITLHSDESQYLTFYAPIYAKDLLKNSFERSDTGGASNFLISRVESIVAAILVAVPAVMFGVVSVVTTPLTALVVAVINLPRFIPGVSSFKSITNFIAASNDVLSRVWQVNWIGLRVVFLFEAEAVLSLIPLVLKKENYFEKTIAELVKPLGDLKTLSAKIPEGRFITGSEEPLSALSSMEEFFRALSKDNNAREIIVNRVYHIQTFRS